MLKSAYLFIVAHLYEIVKVLSVVDRQAGRGVSAGGLLLEARDFRRVNFGGRRKDKDAVGVEDLVNVCEIFRMEVIIWRISENNVEV